jgi:hypothetical protein
LVFFFVDSHYGCTKSIGHHCWNFKSLFGAVDCEVFRDFFLDT